jgi:hypothetical protein
VRCGLWGLDLAGSIEERTSDMATTRLKSADELADGVDAETAAAGRYGRLNVRLNSATAHALQQLASDDATPTEVVRRAIALLKLVDDRRSQGLHVEFVDEEGKRQGRLELLY